MRIVITGASGNVGTALLRRLTGAGHEIVGVCRRPPVLWRRTTSRTWHPLDLAGDDAEDVLTAVSRRRRRRATWPGASSRRTTWRTWSAWTSRGTRAVVGAAQRAGVAHLVHMSSVGAYSPGPAGPGEGRRIVAHGGSRPSPTAATRPPLNGCSTLSSAASGGPAVARMRPGLIVQRESGSALLRYGVPPSSPRRSCATCRCSPLDRGLAVQLVHTDDVADAVARVLERRRPARSTSPPNRRSPATSSPAC